VVVTTGDQNKKRLFGHFDLITSYTHNKADETDVANVHEIPLLSSRAENRSTGSLAYIFPVMYGTRITFSFLDEAMKWAALAHRQQPIHGGPTFPFLFLFFVYLRQQC
jgi:hypothetical protein